MTSASLALGFRRPAARRQPAVAGPALAGALLERVRYRAELRRLLATADYLLADVGLTRAEAAHEVAKPFWQA